MSRARGSFTPGPWTQDWPDCWGDCHVWAGDAVIARVNTIDSTFPPDDATGEANAFLIAAAPDLLEALREVSEYIPERERPVLAQKVRAAIAKAEGK